MLAMVAFMTLAVSQKAQAIEDPNPKGTIVIGVRGGVLPGFGGNVVADYTLINSWWKGHFTVGAYAGYNYSHILYNVSNVSVMPRATYGLNITDKFEVHAGVMAGYCFRHWHESVVVDPNEHHFAHGELAGVRYMFTDNIGAEAELIYTGYMNYFNVGLTFKF